MRIALGLAAALLAATANAAPTPSLPSGPPAPVAPAPPYAVVEGSHVEATTPAQSLTVLCPGGLHAYGAGFSAVIRQPAAGSTPASSGESGLDNVRSFPDSAGTGWQVSGISPDAARLKLPWRLVVRVVCARAPG
jgi:hypothetical protein